jgi:ribose transport system substrate-binding protein
MEEHYKRRLRAGIVLCAMLLAVALVAGCGSSGSGASSSSSTSSSAAPATGSTVSAATSSAAASNANSSSGTSVPSFIPASVAPLYRNFNEIPVTPDPISTYKPPKPPWKFCLSESYEGEAFRTGPPLGSDGMVAKIVGQLHQEGLATGPLITTNSNLNTATQISQINNFVSEGCNVIMSLPASTSGLCSATTNAWDHHVLFVSFGTEITCPHTVSIDVNEYQYGYEAAENLAERLDDKGNILMVNGIEGDAAPEAEAKGAEAAFKQHSGMHVVGQVYGNYTSSIAKSQTLQFVSTHPETLDGVWQAGLMAAAIYQGLQQAGRTQTKVEALSGTCSELALWHQTGGTNYSFLQAGEPYAYEAMQATLRILKGAHPVTNMLLFSIPTITEKTLPQWWNSRMTLNSNCYPNAPAAYRVTANQMNPLFTNLPKTLPTITYFTAPTG